MYPVLPPQVASGEILRVGVAEALLEVRVLSVERADELNLVLELAADEDAAFELET